MSERFEGRVVIVDDSGKEVFEFDPRFAVLDLGSEGNEGDFRLRDNEGRFSFHFDGGRQLILVRDNEGRDALRFDANFAVLDLGAAGNEGDLRLRGNDGSFTIHLDGGSGDIKLLGGDCAEDFDVDATESVEPGTVMVISDERLRPSSRPYDRRVAGVVSGAGGLGAAVRLAHDPGRDGRLPVALNGRVLCRADQVGGPIETGDLLTTSATPGHAMRASDPARSFGAVLGKALAPLDVERGLVPILVALH